MLRSGCGDGGVGGVRAKDTRTDEKNKKRSHAIIRATCEALCYVIIHDLFQL